ncbi:MAG TPA: phenylalanine--tRNA ligase subunit beta [Solirubrobacteraceae bacterium]|jgi:phenylalanyl-tRNA synthetase beta chain|nr:phenylalanine--tRNA ligase subunit beta [Solirubrobacteraceae bacterium]
MRVPIDWLREYCDPSLGVSEVRERLTMSGTKVEAVHHHGVDAVERFVVGRVLEVAQHEKADRLKVCKVDLGGPGDVQPATIVCGAPNVAAGQSVAVARPGAVMPDGTQLQSAKLRGVVSEGMILSASELGLGEDGAGILVLDDLTLDAEFAPGAPLADLLPIATEVLELEITPNRPDCLGVYGVARELHAATGAPLSGAPWEQDPGSPGAVAGAQVTVDCPELCRRFTARVFGDVSIGPSPPWLAARLIAAGQRPINNVVDITNYVMLLTAQPMHAFDLDRVSGGRLVVRRARDGEQVRTLDGNTRTLDSQMVLIEDADGPTSIAGLMGGERSEVAPDTRRVLLEAATWDGPNIHRSSARLGLRSEASGRFEKGLQPEQCTHAQAVAAGLMLELCGARLLEGTIDEAWSPRPAQTLRLREARVRAILGVPVARSRQREILRALDFQCTDAEDGLDATVPALRRDDVTREIDLIEEVARIHGLEHIPATLPARRGAAGRLSREQRLRRAAEDALVGRGLYEIAGWSFCGPELLDRLRLPADDELRAVVRVANPLSEAQSLMRPTLLGSLLDAARHNVFHNGPRIALFESGTVFRQGDSPDGLADERHQLGAVLAGAIAPPSWRADGAEADFFAAKALLEALLGRLGVGFETQRSTRPFLHPGRSASVRGAHGADFGFVGELHPLVAQAWELPRAAAFSVDLGAVIEAAPDTVTFRPYPSVPSLRQDIAVILPDAVAAQQAIAAVRAAAGDVLESVTVFDVYEGEQVGEGRRSLALALSFRAAHETLSDEDIAPVRERIVAALEDLGGELRA